ncbi:rod-binding protein [Pseudooceanicola atlanticus]|jgi:Rod binding domain-containing protein|uniref:Flagellar protein FlgJ N-terminal domain-containing protein n=1 Tax=Pseudooceanicola atlanticus TaxID=1461694 RepID=A0A0A0E9U2_9RHOB|nr:rod-binding protein [Pseudooceanicola atlanticus]KGM46960.1 hypothetical protein ATO9_20760 [Pseudooceanicola atlanticus]
MDISGQAALALTQARQQQATQGQGTSPEVQKTAREFEAVFLTQVVDEMFKTVDLGDMSGGFAEETWRSFMARAFADELAARGSTGISQSVEASMNSYRNAMNAKGGA